MQLREFTLGFCIWQRHNFSDSLEKKRKKCVCELTNRVNYAKEELQFK